MISYAPLRRIHLLAGLFSLAMLLMYGISAVQMAHNSWFHIQPAVSRSELRIEPGLSDARVVARSLASRGIRGELASVEPLRINLPGTVHEVQYDSATGEVHVKTSRSGWLGVLNRLHHAAGFWHDSAWFTAWAALVAVVSLALVTLGITGLWMWFARRQDRLAGAVLLLLNLAFAVTILILARRAGP